MEELHPFQFIGRDFLVERQFAYLADEMGLGKTAQAVTAVEMLQSLSSRPLSVLIACPAIARYTWRNEWEKFSAYRRPFTLIFNKEQTKYHAPPGGNIISSFELLDENAKLFMRPFDILIIDEAHYLKSPDAKRSKTLLGAKGIAHRCKKIWCLSGTPAPNHPGELWIVMRTFGITDLKYNDFLEKYCRVYRSTYGNHVKLRVIGAKLEKLPELKRQLDTFLLRRRKDEVGLQLPPLTFSNITVTASDVELDTHDSFIKWCFPLDKRKEFFKQLSEEERLIETILKRPNINNNALKTLELLATSVSTLRMYTGMQKAPTILKTIKKELQDNAYEKIIIFAVHHAVIKMAREFLSDFKPVTLYGKTPAQRKAENIIKFQLDPRCRVFIGNVNAAGVNITLTSAHNVIFIEQSWVPGDNAQAAMRCHRIGQSKPVHVRIVGLENSIDQRIAQVLTRKASELAVLFNEKRYQVFSVDEEFGVGNKDLKAEQEFEAKHVKPFEIDEGDIFS